MGVDRMMHRSQGPLIKILRQKLHRMIRRKPRGISAVWVILRQVDHIMEDRGSLQNLQICTALCFGNLLAKRPDPPQMPQIMRPILRIPPNAQNLRLISGLACHFFCKCT